MFQSIMFFNSTIISVLIKPGANGVPGLANVRRVRKLAVFTVTFEFVHSPTGVKFFFLNSIIFHD